MHGGEEMSGSPFKTLMRCLALISILFFCFPVFASDFSTVEDRLVCGDTDVRAFTTCGPDPYIADLLECTEQYFLLTDAKTGMSTRIPGSGRLEKSLGAHGKDMGTWLNGVAWEWACVKGRGRRYVMIGYTRGGICIGCEWYELFDLKGHQVAGSKSSPSATEEEATRVVRAFDKKCDALGLPKHWPDSWFRTLRYSDRPEKLF
jgi:hypothetical protein